MNNQPLCYIIKQWRCCCWRWWCCCRHFSRMADTNLSNNECVNELDFSVPRMMATPLLPLHILSCPMLFHIIHFYFFIRVGLCSVRSFHFAHVLTCLCYSLVSSLFFIAHSHTLHKIVCWLDVCRASLIVTDLRRVKDIKITANIQTDRRRQQQQQKR